MSHSMYSHSADHHLSMAVAQSRYSAPASISADQKQHHHQNSTAYHQSRATQPSAAALNLLQQSHSNLLQATMPHHHHLHPDQMPSSASESSMAIVKPAASQELSTYSQLPKHWIWNSSFFYPTARSMHEGFMPYSSNFSGIFSQSKISQREGTIDTAKSIDLTQHHQDQHHNHRHHPRRHESASEDSLDNDDDTNKRTLLETPSPEASASNPTVSNKKKNPYSIEELLKKPEKRIRPSISNFRPAIIIQEKTHSSDCIDDEKSLDEFKHESNNNPIEICD